MRLRTTMLLAALAALATSGAIGIVCGGNGEPAIVIIGERVDVNLEDPAESGEYLFDPAEFVFNRGDQVTFVLTAEGEYHTFTIDALEVDALVDAGATEALTLTFDEPGTYKLICVPHEEFGMTGTITVR